MTARTNVFRAPAVGRRGVLVTGAAALSAGLLPAEAEAATEAANARPQAGDRFVFFSGDKKGEVVRVEDLPLGGPQILAWPVESATETVRQGSRLNQVLLIRLDPASLNEETRGFAAEGVIAYSAVCTHQGCPISQWKADEGTLLCVCHNSQFDPKEGARVVNGPAPRRLAVLPLAIEDGAPVATGEFVGRVGFK
jgi:rieske iron-sulfur protein